MAEDKFDTLRRKDVVNIIVSSPMTKVLSKQVMKADRVMRVADERWSNGLLTTADHTTVRDEVLALDRLLSSKLGELDKLVRSGAKRKRNAQKNGQNPKTKKKPESAKTAKNKTPPPPPSSKPANGSGDDGSAAKAENDSSQPTSGANTAPSSASSNSPAADTLSRTERAAMAKNEEKANQVDDNKFGLHTEKLSPISL